LKWWRRCFFCRSVVRFDHWWLIIESSCKRCAKDR
jgi:hypothetical protein